MTSKIVAMLKNDLGQLLPYTCQATKSQCEEWCAKNLLGWPRLQELGAKIVHVEVTEVPEAM
jgi:hypothetical protein